MKRRQHFGFFACVSSVLIACGGGSQRDTSGAGGASGGDSGGNSGGDSGGKGLAGGSSGRTSTGGVSTGGVSTGGVSTGGVSTGGVSTGGVSTGGVSTGGVSTGGVSTGGVSTGGVSTGGVSTGGVSTGGTTSTCTGLGEDVFVDPAAGSDSGTGSRNAPVKSIHRASTIAATRCARTIWLLDGTYDATTEPRFAAGTTGDCGQSSGVVIPPGVALRAENTGQAKLLISGLHGLCVAGGRISGLAIDRSALGGQVIETRSGTLEVDATTFNHCGYPGVTGLIQRSQEPNSIRACLVLSGEAQVRFAAVAQHQWLGDEAGTFATARDDAKLEVAGGRFGATPSTATMALFAIAERAKLSLSGCDLVSNVEHEGIAFQLQDDSSASLTGTSTLSGFAMASSIETGGTALLFEDVTSSRNVYLTYVTGTSSGKADVTLRRTKASDATAAVLIKSGDVTLSVEASVFDDNTAGILSTGSGQINVVDSRLTNNDVGLRVQPPMGAYSVYIRRTEVSNNNTVGVLLGGILTGTYDLGTLASPGGNVFVDNTSTSGANLVVAGGQAVRVSAIGNTWNASLQGAGADGRYTVSGQGASLDVSGGTGPNYITSTTATIRLAENP